ncbi:hypothetical protein SZN_22871 [Streptomyces zinciresistens K42]|uniref:Uncharacterized protein n=1 Tax=Streptomyces zinciresistens K42 TaxID=700597 RepID=G2GGE0_9ACTN|nr:hypothetical protein [Streptomyces zinciresistens]EGX57428.1 hypothetical protein SZN_22871 [Streptomyces zinciresistens K42]
MNTNPLPLPASALTGGCLPWDGVQARRWLAARPPSWVPVRTRAYVGLAVGTVAAVAAGGLALLGVRGWVAACLALQLLWVLVRPEAVRLAAPVLVVLVLFTGEYGEDGAWAVRLGAVLVLVPVWVTALVRLRARRGQREAALAAAGGVTLPVPFGDAPLGRGKILGGLGVLVLAAGAVLVATSGAWALAEDRQTAPALGWFVAGLGATVLLSGALGRRRADALRREPVPALRVLIRENADLDTQVYAADDLAALRPLFTVATSLVDDEGCEGEEGEEGEEGDGGDGGDAWAAYGGRADGDERDGDADGDEEFRHILDRIDAGLPGPLREAVLYGLPYEGAEVVLVCADEEPGEPVVVERSTGPVRPLSDRAARRLVAGCERAEADEAERRGAVAELTGRLRGDPSVRVWRAGWLDRLWPGLVAVWACVPLVGASGIERYAFGLALGLLIALYTPRRFAWRITADRDGLWFNGLRGARLMAWDEIRAVVVKGGRLKIDGGRSGVTEWAVDTVRWRPLERRLNLRHPQDRVAAEITAMWREPGARPPAVGDASLRGRPLWPLAVVIGLAWTVLVVWG